MQAKKPHYLDIRLAPYFFEKMLQLDLGRNIGKNYPLSLFPESPKVSFLLV